MRGMFAFALWDARSRELWLVRDRVGIKPLYYAVHHERLVFASEIKALLLDPQQERAVDEASLYHYLSFLCVPAPRTLFRGIRKLEPGCWLRVSADGDVREERWWDAWDDVEPLTGVPEAEIERRVLAELRTSVQLRKVSDVPVGVFLSGGVDSSTNAALFSEGESSPVKTFSIGYDEDYASYPSELPYARRMAEAVGAEHHERILSLDDLLDFLPEMARLQDEPIADPVCFPALLRVGACAPRGRDRRARRARAPTSSSSATRRGGRSSACSRRTTCRCQASGSGSRRCARPGRATRLAVRVSPPRRRRPAGVLGWRGGVHGGPEAAAALAAAPARARRPHVVGRARADSQPGSTRRRGSRRT